MRELTPDSPEHKDNGHYVIQGVDYYSVWTFKKLFRYGIDNVKTKNTLATIEMESIYGLPLFKGLIEVGEDKGKFVQLHRKADLEDFLPKKRLGIQGK